MREHYDMKEPWRSILIILLTAFVSTTGTYAIATRQDLNGFTVDMLGMKKDVAFMSERLKDETDVEKEDKAAAAAIDADMRVEFSNRLLSIANLTSENLKAQAEQTRMFTSLIELLKDRQERPKLNLDSFTNVWWVANPNIP